MDGIECPDRVAGKRLTRTINHLARDSQDLPMSSSGNEVCSTVSRFCLRQFLERHCPEQHAVALDQREV